MTTTAPASNMEQRLAAIGKRIDRLLESAGVNGTIETARSGLSGELKRMEDHFAAAKAQIRQDLAVTRTDLADAFREELDVWKARSDDLRVQVALGEMELRDRTAPVLEAIDSTIGRIRRDVDELAHAHVVDEEALTRSVEDSMKSLRSEVAAAEELR